MNAGAEFFRHRQRAAKYFSMLKEAGLECAIGTIDMGNDPPFVKGFNNPKYRAQVLKATKDSIDACSEYGYKNVICFTGMSEGIPDDVGATNCVDGFKEILGHAEKNAATIKANPGLGVMVKLGVAVALGLLSQVNQESGEGETSAMAASARPFLLAAAEILLRA